MMQRAAPRAKNKLSVIVSLRHPAATDVEAVIATELVWAVGVSFDAAPFDLGARPRFIFPAQPNGLGSKR